MSAEDDKGASWEVEKDRDRRTPPNSIDILYLKPRHLCVVDKPADVFIEGSEDVTAIKLTKEKLSSLGHNHSYFHFINRLDFATSGVMVFGLSRPAAAAGTECFQNRRASKVYVAVVEGHVPVSWDTGVFIDSPLAQSPDSDFLQTIGTPSNTGRACLTQVMAVDRGMVGDHKVSKVLVWIRSGRRHQIRVHLASLGYPVAGDFTYGRGYPLSQAGRMALHAWKLIMRLENNAKTHYRKRKHSKGKTQSQSSSEYPIFSQVAAEAKDPFNSYKCLLSMDDHNTTIIGGGLEIHTSAKERVSWTNVETEKGSNQYISFPFAWRPAYLSKYKSATIIFFTRTTTTTISNKSSRVSSKYKILLHRARKGDTIKGRWMSGFGVQAGKHKPQIHKARLATDFDSANLCSSLIDDLPLVVNLLKRRSFYRQRLQSASSQNQDKNKNFREKDKNNSYDYVEIDPTGPSIPMKSTEVSEEDEEDGRSFLRTEFEQDLRRIGSSKGLGCAFVRDTDDKSQDGHVVYLVYVPPLKDRAELNLMIGDAKEKRSGNTTKNVHDATWWSLPVEVYSYTPKNQSLPREYIRSTQGRNQEVNPVISTLLRDPTKFGSFLGKISNSFQKYDSQDKQPGSWVSDSKNPYIFQTHLYEPTPTPTPTLTPSPTTPNPTQKPSTAKTNMMISTPSSPSYPEKIPSQVSRSTTKVMVEGKRQDSGDGKSRKAEVINRRAEARVGSTRSGLSPLLDRASPI
ncbi:hypothetical protein AAMO2058_000207100 [Amorphochlora amoebiformis]